MKQLFIPTPEKKLDCPAGIKIKPSIRNSIFQKAVNLARSTSSTDFAFEGLLREYSNRQLDNPAWPVLSFGSRFEKGRMYVMHMENYLHELSAEFSKKYSLGLEARFYQHSVTLVRYEGESVYGEMHSPNNTWMLSYVPGKWEKILNGAYCEYIVNG